MSRIDDLTRILGQDALEKLAGEFGGRRLVVPKIARLGPTHPLVQLLGMDVAQRLSKHFDGEYIEIPKCSRLERKRRNEAIRRDRATGMTQAALARRYGVTERWVRAIVNRLPDA